MDGDAVGNTSDCLRNAPRDLTGQTVPVGGADSGDGGRTTEQLPRIERRELWLSDDDVGDVTIVRQDDKLEIRVDFIGKDISDDASRAHETAFVSTGLGIGERDRDGFRRHPVSKDGDICRIGDRLVEFIPLHVPQDADAVSRLRENGKGCLWPEVGESGFVLDGEARSVAGL